MFYSYQEKRQPRNPVSFNNNIFLECFIPIKRNDNHGNAVFCYHSQTNISYSSYTSCSPDKDKKGDSCIFLNNETFFCNMLNGSYNNGFGGAGMIAIWNGYSDTFIKYCQVNKCFDNFFLEFTICSYPAIFCNFIDATAQGYIFWVSPNQIATFEDCTFINCSKKDFGGGGSFEFIRCSSNEKLAMTDLIPFITYNKIEINIRQCILETYSNCFENLIETKINLILEAIILLFSD